MSTPASSPPEPAVQVAARLLAEGRPVEAARRLADLVAEAPTYAAAHVLRATALEAAGRIDDALVSWGRAAALVPGSPLVHRERERLLATRVADDLPPDLPPAVPDPAAPPYPPAAFPTSIYDDLEGADFETGAPAEERPTNARPMASVEPLAAPLDVEDDPVDLGPDDEEVDGPLLNFGAPRGAPRSEPDVVDAEPGADALEATVPEPEVDEVEPEAETAEDGPLFGYGAPRTLDASDLFFGDTAAPPESPAAPSVETPDDGEPAADEPSEYDPFADTPDEASPADAPTLSPSGSDWGADDTGLAPVLPPEGEVEPAPEPEDEVGEGDGDGWDVLAEADIPTPPPGTYAEPDVVAPEDPEPEPEVEDPFADVDAVVDEFGAAEPEAPADRSVADELDALISQLEDAPRIRPDPEYAGPDVELDHGEVDDMVSETLAKIYAAQHQYVEAALVYEKRAARQPDQAEELLERAAELRQRGG
ncbi:tetratricopeptide repeat protein [Rubrivirga marina]|uniref:Tetratricopeptide repeat protein n=1 Tax=Rubrivirga marina TaxID=1196024 RepID=A0A271J5E4_9BACT|nr:tetratricopeptide repeat protein [Rubrivirga marina]PAP78528.1 hypothetical protein BSZ37_19915 [Rubrivirga marina]